MRRLLIGILGGALFSAPAFGQSAIGRAVPPPVTYVSPTVDPAKLQLARSVATRLLPPGTTGELLRAPLNLAVANLVHDYLMMPVERFAREHGAKLPVEGVNGPPMVRVRLLEILDPASQSRLQVMDRIIRQMAADAAATKEPQLREAMALAYGQGLSVSELQELDRFLSTPAGRPFAHTSAMLDNDLGVFAARQTVSMAMRDAIPAMMSRIVDATASLPKIRGSADLSDAERKEVAQLLGVDQSQLRKQ